MKALLSAARPLLTDLASTILFFGAYVLTGRLAVAVALGLGLAAGQIGWELLRRRPIDTLQWISAVMVLSSGSAALVTDNPIFMMVKPSLMYLMVGAAMLKHGWMRRYLPPRALEFLPDLTIAFGYVWAGLMFLSAALNLILALDLSVAAWGMAMTIWSIASKTTLFLGQYGLMKFIGRRRAQAMAAA